VVAYLDSGVLLAAWRNAELRPSALRIMEDRQAEFVTSRLVALELLPKPVFEKRPIETAFYQTHFRKAAACQSLDAALGNDAQALAERYGLGAVDALHIAAAVRLGAQEFYTTERPGKPMFRVKEFRMISLHSL
jgi:predicted nucleic acid-binding protein